MQGGPGLGGLTCLDQEESSGAVHGPEPQLLVFLAVIPLSTGAVITYVQLFQGAGNRVSKDVRGREKGEKQTESFGESCC